MGRVIGWELEILGSHGMAAADYGPMLDLVASGRLRPDALVTGVIGLSDVPAALAAMGDAPPTGITVITPARPGLNAA
jgi:alcohol dehydrogenase